jgi:5-methylthioadenosine/S-adenosylhomocysteine deaminase
MEGRLLLRDCALCPPAGPIQSGLSIVIDGPRVSAIGASRQLPTLPGDWEVACAGRLVTMGFIDCHAHLVGRQLAPIGTGPDEAGRSQQRRALEGALTAADVEVLTAFGIARALRSGITLSVEHLHCPTEVASALQRQATAIERIGARAVITHRSSSVEGSAAGLDQLGANALFAGDFHHHDLIRPGLGFAPPELCDDSFLRRLSQISEELGLAIHGELGEGPGDQAVTRLRSFGLLERNAAIAANSAEQLLALLQARAPRLWPVLVPPHHSGQLPATTNSEVLSTDRVGIGSGDRTLQDGWSWALSLVGEAHLDQLGVQTPAKFGTDLYGGPLDAVREGALADLVVWDHVPSQENPGGVLPYLIERVVPGPAAWTIVNGRVVVREGRLLAHDYASLAQEAAATLNLLRPRANVPAS